MANLPGQNNPNTPPLPGSQPQPVTPIPDFWQSSSRIVTTVLAIYAAEGKEAAQNALTLAKNVLDGVSGGS